MLNKIRKLQNKKGFTLVELIVVIAIIAVLTAVIVPLIGRYSTQAAYTTLQDAAQTISNNLNTCMSEVSMKGTPANCVAIQGKKAGGTLTITVDGTACTSASTGTDMKTLIGVAVAKNLENTVPDGGSFSAETKGGAVVGVIYSNKSDIDVSGDITAAGGAATVKGQCSAVADFTSAYEKTSGNNPVGLSGACIPTASAT